MLYKYMLTDGFICAYLRCRWGTDSAQCRPKMFGVWTLVGPWNHFWWGPGSLQGKVQFFGGPSKHDDVGPTSERDVAFRRRPDVISRRRPDAAPHRSDVGPLPGRWANDVVPTSITATWRTSYWRRPDVVVFTGERHRPLTGTRGQGLLFPLL